MSFRDKLINCSIIEERGRHDGAGATGLEEGHSIFLEIKTQAGPDMKIRMISVASVVANSLLGLVIIAVVPFAWLLRDGLGPNAVESAGMEALARCFMTFYTGPVVIVTSAVAIALHLMKSRKPHGAP